MNEGTSIRAHDAELRRRRVDELAGLVRQGRNEYFEELYGLTENAVYRHAYRCLMPSGLAQSRAEDLTQETWMKAVSKISTYDPSQSFLAWMQAIARNAASDMTRRSARRPEELTAEMVTLDAPSPGETADDRLVRLEDARNLLDEVNSLSAKQREVVIQHYWIGLTFGEIAEVMCEKLPSVWKLHQRALAKLERTAREVRLTAGREPHLVVLDQGTSEREAGARNA